jgi:small GTP-binding protein
MRPPPAYKVIVVGASGVGKTSLVDRLIDKTFSGTVPPTVGAAYRPYTLPAGITLNIWDTAGQERYRSVARPYYRASAGALLVFAVDDASSFNQLDEWLREIQDVTGPNIPILLVGNKTDLRNSAKDAVTDQTAARWATGQNLDYIATSAQNDENVADAFVRLSRAIQTAITNGSLKVEPVPETSPIDPDPYPDGYYKDKDLDYEENSCPC